ncbi:MAG: hypothetical protein KAR54_02360 [Candidatus Pacebacteria bacterium]|nr:hypothetical protein [Candidatus Paceibacterota bacterium]
MNLELDFLPIGEKTQCGDALILSYGNLKGQRYEYSIVVVDSGFQENGDHIVDHIKNTYDTDVVDLLISTHPDQDHSGGIPIVLEKLDVKKIWMHKPWDHTENIAKLFTNPSVTDQGVKKEINKSLSTVKEVEKIAKRKGIPIIEPFTGLKDESGCLVVLGPDEKFYKEELIPNFRCTPESKDDSIVETIKDKLGEISESIKDYVDEKWDLETLDDSGETTAENNSSTILLLNINDNHILLTSDAGQPALTRVVNLLDSEEYDYSKIKLIQVPHHGSHRNISPDLLDKLIGPKLDIETDIATKITVVSIARELDDKHPSKKVMNAFKRRGGPVHATNGGLKYYGIGDVPRQNEYPSSKSLPFFYKVEKHTN